MVLYGKLQIEVTEMSKITIEYDVISFTGISREKQNIMFARNCLNMAKALNKKRNFECKIHAEFLYSTALIVSEHLLPLGGQSHD